MTVQSEDSERIEMLIDKLGTAINGEVIGHIIPALIYMLAMMHDEKIESAPEFMKGVVMELTGWIEKREAMDAEQKGTMQWLQ